MLQGVISKPADAEPTSAPQVSCKPSPLLAVAANVKMAMHHASLNTNCEHMCVLIFCKPSVHMQANHPGSRIPWCAAKVSMPLLCAASAEQFKTRRTSSQSCFEHAVRSFLCAHRGASMNGKHNECKLQTLRHQVCADGKLYCKHGAFICRSPIPSRQSKKMHCPRCVCCCDMFEAMQTTQTGCSLLLHAHAICSLAPRWHLNHEHTACVQAVHTQAPAMPLEASSAANTVRFVLLQ